MPESTKVKRKVTSVRAFAAANSESEGNAKGRSVEFADQTLTCKECGSPFLWTAGEQQFYHEKGLINVPARCTSCRAARKAKLGLQERPQSEVVCAECGEKTTVPFVPRNGNPVYCSRCFETIKAASEVGTAG